MLLKKEYSSNKKKCKVTFFLPKDIADNFNSISVVGDFNQWDPHANLFSEKEADGSYSVAVILEANNKYQFRYLADGIHWFNEAEADGEVESYYKGSKNSVIVI
jgi:1,4-alpha-glucan branching enzyme